MTVDSLIKEEVRTALLPVLKELEIEWKANHDEHCGNLPGYNPTCTSFDGPKYCYWIRPKSLGGPDGR